MQSPVHLHSFVQHKDRPGKLLGKVIGIREQVDGSRLMDVELISHVQRCYRDGQGIRIVECPVHEGYGGIMQLLVDDHWLQPWDSSKVESA